MRAAAAAAALCAAVSAQDAAPPLPPMPQYTPLHTNIPMGFANAGNQGKTTPKGVDGSLLDEYGNRMGEAALKMALRHAKSVIIDEKNMNVHRAGKKLHHRNHDIDVQYRIYVSQFRRVVDRKVDDAKGPAEAKCELAKQEAEHSQAVSLRPIADKYAQKRHHAAQEQADAMTAAQASYAATTKAVRQQYEQAMREAARMQSTARAAEEAPHPGGVGALPLFAVAAIAAVAFAAWQHSSAGAAEVPMKGAPTGATDAQYRTV